MDYKLPTRIENSNKSTYGKVLNIAGSDYMPGAAFLSSVSALKMGCGYCFLASTERVIDAVAAQSQNIVFLPIAKCLDYLLDVNVVEIGCGISQENFAVELFKSVIANIPIDTPIIIDADGLNILSNDCSYYLDRGLKNVVLTPHPKEASRLLNVHIDEILANTTKYAVLLAKKYKSTVVLKSHRTIIATQNGEIHMNTSGNNAMAKAGSGDVLTGMISGLIAQGLDLYNACVTAVFLHGLAGDIARVNLTEYSVMANDLINYIPEAIKQIK